MRSRLLKSHVRFEVEMAGPERIREIERRLQPHGLFDRIRDQIPGSRKALRSVQVFGSAPAGERDEDIQRAKDQFASQAAPFVAEILGRSTLVGVAWGSTIGCIVEALEGMRLKPATDNGPEFCPLVGEPMRHKELRFSSSRLAARLGELFNSKGRPTPSLAGVPALMPQSFSDEEVLMIKKLLWSFDDHARVFGAPDKEYDPNALVHCVDTIFTGAGPADQAIGHPNDAFVRGGGVVRAELEPLIFGDVCGVLLPRPNLSPDEQQVINRIRLRWGGIDEATLVRCAKRSPEHGGAGVLAACVGEKSQVVVLEALRRGLFNHLVVDQPLADALQSSLDETTGDPAAAPVEAGSSPSARVAGGRQPGPRA